MASYINRKDKVFLPAGDCPRKINRQRPEGALKSYNSCTDTRVWEIAEEPRRQHLRDLLNSPLGLQLGNYVPIENLIDILMGEGKTRFICERCLCKEKLCKIRAETHNKSIISETGDAAEAKDGYGIGKIDEQSGVVSGMKDSTEVKAEAEARAEAETEAKAKAEDEAKAKAQAEADAKVKDEAEVEAEAESEDFIEAEDKLEDMSKEQSDAVAQLADFTEAEQKDEEISELNKIRDEFARKDCELAAAKMEIDKLKCMLIHVKEALADKTSQYDCLLESLEQIQLKQEAKECTGSVQECCQTETTSYNVETMEAELLEMQNNYKTLMTENQCLKQELCACYSDIDERQSIIDDQQRKIIALEETVQCSKKRNKSESKCAALEEKIKKYKTEIKELSAKLNDLITRDEQGSISRTERECYMARIEQLASFESAYNKVQQQLADMQHVTAERDMLRMKLLNYKYIDDEMERLRYKAKEQEVLNIERNQLKERVQQLENIEVKYMELLDGMESMEQLKLERDRFKSQLDQLMREKYEQQNIIIQTRKEIDTLVTQIEELSTQSEINMVPLEEFQYLLTQLNEKQHLLVSYEQQSKSFDNFKTELSEIQDQLASAIRDVQEQHNINEELFRNLQAEKQFNIKQITSRYVFLNKIFLHKNFEQIKEMAQAEYAQLKELLVAKEKEYENLELKHFDYVTNESLQQHETELTETKRITEERLKDIEKLEILFKEKYERSSPSTTRIIEDIEKEHQKIIEIQNEIGQLKSDPIHNQINEMTEKIKIKQTEIIDAQKEIEKIHQVNTSADITVNKLTTTINDLTDNIERKQLDISGVKKKIDLIQKFYLAALLNEETTTKKLLAVITEAIERVQTKQKEILTVPPAQESNFIKFLKDIETELNSIIEIVTDENITKNVLSKKVTDAFPLGTDNLSQDSDQEKKEIGKIIQIVKENLNKIRKCQLEIDKLKTKYAENIDILEINQDYQKIDALLNDVNRLENLIKESPKITEILTLDSNYDEINEMITKTKMRQQQVIETQKELESLHENFFKIFSDHRSNIITEKVASVIDNFTKNVEKKQTDTTLAKMKINLIKNFYNIAVMQEELFTKKLAIIINEATKRIQGKQNEILDVKREIASRTLVSSQSTHVDSEIVEIIKQIELKQNEIFEIQKDIEQMRQIPLPELSWDKILNGINFATTQAETTLDSSDNEILQIIESIKQKHSEIMNCQQEIPKLKEQYEENVNFTKIFNYINKMLDTHEKQVTETHISTVLQEDQNQLDAMKEPIKQLFLEIIQNLEHISKYSNENQKYQSTIKKLEAEIEKITLLCDKRSKIVHFNNYIKMLQAEIDADNIDTDASVGLNIVCKHIDDIAELRDQIRQSAKHQTKDNEQLIHSLNTSLEKLKLIINTLDIKPEIKENLLNIWNSLEEIRRLGDEIKSLEDDLKERRTDETTDEDRQLLALQNMIVERSEIISGLNCYLASIKDCTNPIRTQGATKDNVSEVVGYIHDLIRLHQKISNLEENMKNLMTQVDDCEIGTEITQIEKDLILKRKLLDSMFDNIEKLKQNIDKPESEFHVEDIVDQIVQMIGNLVVLRNQVSTMDVTIKNLNLYINKKIRLNQINVFRNKISENEKLISNFSENILRLKKNLNQYKTTNQIEKNLTQLLENFSKIVQYRDEIHKFEGEASKLQQKDIDLQLLPEHRHDKKLLDTIQQLEQDINKNKIELNKLGQLVEFSLNKREDFLMQVNKRDPLQLMAYLNSITELKMNIVKKENILKELLTQININNENKQIILNQIDEVDKLHLEIDACETEIIDRIRQIPTDMLEGDEIAKSILSIQKLASENIKVQGDLKQLKFLEMNSLKQQHITENELKRQTESLQNKISHNKSLISILLTTVLSLSSKSTQPNVQFESPHKLSLINNAINTLKGFINENIITINLFHNKRVIQENLNKYINFVIEIQKDILAGFENIVENFEVIKTKPILKYFEEMLDLQRKSYSDSQKIKEIIYSLNELSDEETEYQNDYIGLINKIYKNIIDRQCKKKLLFNKVNQEIKLNDNFAEIWNIFKQILDNESVLNCHLSNLQKYLICPSTGKVQQLKHDNLQYEKTILTLEKLRFSTSVHEAIELKKMVELLEKELALLIQENATEIFTTEIEARERLIKELFELIKNITRPSTKSEYTLIVTSQHKNEQTDDVHFENEIRILKKENSTLKTGHENLLLVLTATQKQFYCNLENIQELQKQNKELTETCLKLKHEINELKLNKRLEDEKQEQITDLLTNVKRLEDQKSNLQRTVEEQEKRLNIIPDLERKIFNYRYVLTRIAHDGHFGDLFKLLNEAVQVLEDQLKRSYHQIARLRWNSFVDGNLAKTLQEKFDHYQEGEKQELLQMVELLENQLNNLEKSYSEAPDKIKDNKDKEDPDKDDEGPKGKETIQEGLQGPENIKPSKNMSFEIQLKLENILKQPISHKAKLIMPEIIEFQQIETTEEQVDIKPQSTTVESEEKLKTPEDEIPETKLLLQKDLPENIDLPEETASVEDKITEVSKPASSQIATESVSKYYGMVPGGLLTDSSNVVDNTMIPCSFKSMLGICHISESTVSTISSNFQYPRELETASVPLMEENRLDEERQSSVQISSIRSSSQRTSSMSFLPLSRRQSLSKESMTKLKDDSLESTGKEYAVPAKVDDELLTTEEVTEELPVATEKLPVIIEESPVATEELLGDEEPKGKEIVQEGLQDTNNIKSSRNMSFEIQLNLKNILKKPISNKEKPVPEELPVETEELPENIEYLPVITEEFLAEVEDLPVVAEEFPDATEELPAETEELPEEIEELPEPTEELPTEMEDMQAETEELLEEAEELPIETEELPIKAEELSVEIEELPEESPKLLAETEELLAETEELPVETEALPEETEEFPVEMEKLPAEAEELPAEDEELPVPTEELPTATEELPVPTKEPSVAKVPVKEDIPKQREVPERKKIYRERKVQQKPRVQEAPKKKEISKGLKISEKKEIPRERKKVPEKKIIPKEPKKVIEKKEIPQKRDTTPKRKEIPKEERPKEKPQEKAPLSQPAQPKPKDNCLDELERLRNRLKECERQAEENLQNLRTQYQRNSKTLLSDFNKNISKLSSMNEETCARLESENDDLRRQLEELMKKLVQSEVKDKKEGTGNICKCDKDIETVEHRPKIKVSSSIACILSKFLYEGIDTLNLCELTKLHSRICRMAAALTERKREDEMTDEEKLVKRIKLLEQNLIKKQQSAQNKLKMLEECIRSERSQIAEIRTTFRSSENLSHEPPERESVSREIQVIETAACTRCPKHNDPSSSISQIRLFHQQALQSGIKLCKTDQKELYERFVRSTKSGSGRTCCSCRSSVPESRLSAGKSFCECMKSRKMASKKCLMGRAKTFV